QVYSNTGGQASKASPKGSIALFASGGKKTNKKDLAKIALTYDHVYVGSICLGANPNQAIKVLNEASDYDGPSIVFAYAPCIAQGILKGMETTIQEEKEATLSGYYPIFHYNPETEEFKLDSKADFSRYYEFLNGEDRYKMLQKLLPDNYKEILSENKKNAIKRYKYYESLENKMKEEE
ncbi:MAG: pyruvate:ferredoxin (flavodoxin) oxidoreductase, partial [Bacilli bacterium]